MEVYNQRFLLVEHPEKQVDGKLIKVDGERSPLGRGEVVRAAPDVKNNLTGKYVIFDRRQALPLKLQGTEYLLVHESMVYVGFDQSSA
ncbi:MAG: hypothetical protein E6R04_01805 [Spirochaetes bacterium]|nr:MAG: hypothetical protein E6R04_01805 [Spirochaetota bacterium]